MQEPLWGAYRGYREAELVTNRASMLLYGGSAADRKAWAEESQRSFAAEGPLREVSSAGELTAALEPGRGVVYLPDALALGLEAQGQVVRVLLQREERPKIIVGLPTAPQVALERGTLREDLLYRLQMAQVDLSVPETREAVRLRRQKEAERRATESSSSGHAAPKAAEKAKQRPPVKVGVSKGPVRVGTRKAEKK